MISRVHYTLLPSKRLVGRGNRVGSGKKFEVPKKLNFIPLKLFSSNFFLVHRELEVLQRWQTTHFKAYLTLKDKNNGPCPEIHLELSEH